MPVYTTQVTIPMDSQVNADSVVNNWHFSDNGLAGPSLQTKIASWHTALQTFYSAISTTIFPTMIAHDLVRMKTYDLDDVTPRTPLRDELKPITAPTVSSLLPHELCIVLSFNSTFLSGMNPARRRGRVFLGPLASGLIATGTDDARVSSAARSTIASAAAVLRTGPTPDQGWFWRTLSSFAPANANPRVVNGFVDEAFDIQRSRGVPSRTRTTF